MSHRPSCDITPILIVVAGLAALVLTAAALRYRPALGSSRHPRPILVAVAVGSLLGAASGAEPTVLWPVNVVLGAAFGAAVAYAGRRARRWSWLVAGGLGAVAAEGHWRVAAFALLGAAVATTTSGRRRPLFGVCWCTALVPILLHLSWPRVTGTATAVSAAALLVLALSGWRDTPRAQRARARLVLTSAAAAVLVVVGVAAITALTARPSLERGARAAEAGLRQGLTGDSDAASRELRTASTSLARADRLLSGWWTRPALAIPVVSQHVAATHRLLPALIGVAQPAETAAARVGGPELRAADGGVDLDALGSLSEPLTATVEGLGALRTARAATDSVWLVPPVASRLDRLDKQVRQAEGQGETALAVAEVLPDLLGGERPRRYFVAMQVLSEQRASGGIIGAYAELLLEDGSFSLTRQAPIAELVVGNRQPELTLSGPLDFLARYGNVTSAQRYIQNATLSPDFPTVGSIVEELYPQITGQKVDGVVSLDAVALAGLLDLAGPVNVASWPEPVTADNVVSILGRDQYVRFPNGTNDGFVAEMIGAVIDQLRSGQLPPPARVLAAMGPAVRGGHLKVHSAIEAEQAVLTRVGLAGAMTPVRGDYLLVTTQNLGSSKIDWFQQRAVTYSARYDPATGAVRSSARVQVTNDAPARGFSEEFIGGHYTPALGYSKLWISVYSPFKATGATVDGRPVAMSSTIELGRAVHAVEVLLPPGTTSVAEISLEGRLTQDAGYQLDVGRQATYLADAFEVRLDAADGGESLCIDDLPGAEPCPSTWQTVQSTSLRVRATTQRSHNNNGHARQIDLHGSD